MQPMRRVQENIVNTCERRFLDWTCEAMPEQVTPDHLTMFGVFGAVVVFAGYVMSRSDPQYLWVSASGYVIHWLGDSLDGSLARHRRVTRPRYGYFLDHSVDALCILMMVGGMGLTVYVRMDVALLVVVGYFALSIHVFLKNHVTGTFQLSFLALGPTELRIGFVALTLWMYSQGPSEIRLGGLSLSTYDAVLIGLGTTFLALFMLNTLAVVLDLRAREGDGRRRSVASQPSRVPAEARPRGVKDATAY